MGLEQKKRYLILHREDANFRRLCAMLRIAPKTGYAWIRRFEALGIEGLLNDKPRGRPRRSVPQDAREKILSIRKENGWNEKKIHSQLEGVSYHAVRRVLAEAKALGIAPPRRRRVFREFERPLPNHLWQADFSLLDDGSWLFAMIDDHSRYLVDAMEFEDITSENALFVCRRAVRQHGVPYQLMTDHGVQFWNNQFKRPNGFGETLDALGVQHILAGVKRPQTNGKIERWFGTFKDESPRFRGLDEYLYHYNFCRPHGGIKYRKPCEKYFAFKL